ncbi:ENTH/VHS domain-containing protein [Heterostelium album PN500]|uniref:ENTH/VHS domain-containing protein n=1 Tax=Heterostelium pallidum (strain ATCC 26659 / Pp 5 / PN500) TaxID=670386 RepID=D3BFQ6_HETP5|nr:ENTH/VHS domain-containing protein [Heterostelium album PN500]EFA79970.1 ENTH/VHS domain-containing protein [Heterostelium album PN500]|eukprot:XP_020432090.1 ENTH/VHS domain-containing protein [Heterostelium album PN500]
MSIPSVTENEEEIESKIEKDFESSLKRFGVSDSSINHFMNGDGMLFTRSQPTKEELEQHKQALDKQGDYFLMDIKLSNNHNHHNNNKSVKVKEEYLNSLIISSNSKNVDNNNENHLLVNFSHLLLQKIINEFESNLDRIVFTLICKRWYDQRNKILTFNKDRLLITCNVDALYKFQMKSYLNLFRQSLVQNDINRKSSTLGINCSRLDLVGYDYYVLIDSNDEIEKIKIPSDVRKLCFSNFFNDSLAHWKGLIERTNITSLEVGFEFNQPIRPGTLPSNLREFVSNLEDEFYYDHTYIPEKGLSFFPMTLHTIEAPATWLSLLKRLPSLQTLLMDRENQPALTMSDFPDTLTELDFNGNCYALNPQVIPLSIRHLNLSGCKYSLETIDPDTQERTLFFSEHANFETLDLGRGVVDNTILPGQLPKRIRKLVMNSYRDTLQPGSIPDGVEILEMGTPLGFKAGIVPASVRELTLNSEHSKQPLVGGAIPNTVEKLKLVYYTQRIGERVLPDSIKHLDITTELLKLNKIDDFVPMTTSTIFIRGLHAQYELRRLDSHQFILMETFKKAINLGIIQSDHFNYLCGPTKTGSLELSKEHVNALKSIVRQSNLYVKCAHDLCMEKLASKHCQVRLSALNIINELFMRSKYFRELLCEQLTVLFENAVGTDATKPLPPPAQTALFMRPKALEYIERWYEAFGEHYMHLRIGYHYLKNSLKIQFPDVRNQQLQRSRAEDERKEKTQQLLKTKYNQLRLEFDGIRAKIDKQLDVLDGLFGKLIPSDSNFDDLFKDNNDNEDDNNNNNNSQGSNKETAQYQDEIVREGGFGNFNYEIEVTVEKDDIENISKSITIDKKIEKQMIDNLEEIERMQLLIVNDWYTTLIKIDLSAQSNTEYSNYLRQVIDLQSRINNIKSRCNEVNIKVPPPNEKNNNNNNNNNNNEASYIDDEGNEMEMVGGDNNNNNNEDDEYADIEFEQVTSNNDDDNNNNNNNYNNYKRSKTTRTTTTTTTITTTTSTTNSPPKLHKPYLGNDIAPPSVDELPDDESIEDLYKRAPVVETHPSLMHWGKKEINLHKGLEVEHRFLGAANSEPMVPISTFVTLNQMTTVYEPPVVVIKACRFPMKNGELCPRRDLKICPFHGKIIDRDEQGYPSKELSQSEIEEINATKPISNKEKQKEKEKEKEKEKKKRKSTSGLEPLNRDPLRERIDQLSYVYLN